MNPRICLSRRNFVIGAAASAVIATPRISAAAGPTIRVQPDNDLQDIPLSIRLSDFSPRQPVMVTAEMVTRDHFRWRSAAMFVVGADGEVDVGTTAPVGGSYSGVSPMGLIWSMECQQIAMLRATPARRRATLRGRRRSRYAEQ